MRAPWGLPPVNLRMPLQLLITRFTTITFIKDLTVRFALTSRNAPHEPLLFSGQQQLLPNEHELRVSNEHASDLDYPVHFLTSLSADSSGVGVSCGEFAGGVSKSDGTPEQAANRY